MNIINKNVPTYQHEIMGGYLSILCAPRVTSTGFLQELQLLTNFFYYFIVLTEQQLSSQSSTLTQNTEYQDK